MADSITPNSRPPTSRRRSLEEAKAYKGDRVVDDKLQRDMLTLDLAAERMLVAIDNEVAEHGVFTKATLISEIVRRSGVRLGQP